ncbi:MAG: hypothetical protein PQJ60_08440, partial [Spirochaetales bacterium]|nr:hypothetical protein [Spirochaetales bacterium]
SEMVEISSRITESTWEIYSFLAVFHPFEKTGITDYYDYFSDSFYFNAFREASDIYYAIGVFEDLDLPADLPEGGALQKYLLGLGYTGPIFTYRDVFGEILTLREQFFKEQAWRIQEELTELYGEYLREQRGVTLVDKTSNWRPIHISWEDLLVYHVSGDLLENGYATLVHEDRTYSLRETLPARDLVTDLVQSQNTPKRIRAMRGILTGLEREPVLRITLDLGNNYDDVADLLIHVGQFVLLLGLMTVCFWGWFFSARPEKKNSWENGARL